MSSILITGGTGFFGHAFVRQLLKQPLVQAPRPGDVRYVPVGCDMRNPLPIERGEGYSRICIYSRDEHKQAAMREEFGHDKRLRFFIGDVRDGDRLCRAMIGVQDVIHAAALKRIEVGAYDPEEMVKTNVVGAMNVVEACFLAGVRRCVYLSSDKAFQPVSPYGQSKALAESLFLRANHTMGADGPRFAVTRYGNVAGSTGSVIPRWRELLKNRKPLELTDPTCTRFWMTADEAVQLVMKALREMPDMPLIPELPAFSIGDLAEAMAPGGNLTVKGLQPWEKRHESMDFGRSSDAAPQLSVEALKMKLEAI